jgi:hypothetical protein
MSLRLVSDVLEISSDENETSAAPDSAKKPTVSLGEIENEGRPSDTLVCQQSWTDIDVRYTNTPHSRNNIQKQISSDRV